MPFGAAAVEGGVRFRLWAPKHASVTVVIDNFAARKLDALEGGWHELLADDARPGSQYRFVLPDGLRVPDPASRWQRDGVHGRDARFKLAATATLLEHRRLEPSLYAAGGYDPLVVDGPAADRVCAFARRDGATALIAAVVRFPARLDSEPLSPETAPSCRKTCRAGGGAISSPGLNSISRPAFRPTSCLRRCQPPCSCRSDVSL
jgi:hypothetical protein